MGRSEAAFSPDEGLARRGSERPSEPDPAGAPLSETFEAELARLALAYQAGDRAALAALHRAVRPLTAAAFAFYRQHPGVLPPTLDFRDLFQESWLILADLAERWRPEGGSFPAYFRASFPGQLDHFVYRNSPARRTKRLQMLAAERPEVQEELGARADADGREWDGDLAWSELLERLSDDERAVLLLRLANSESFATVAQALRVTRTVAFRRYRNALRRLIGPGATLLVRGRQVLLDPRDLNTAHEGDLVMLVRALHAGRYHTGRLPARTWLLEQTGLPRRRLLHLLALLERAGCIQGRRGRSPGYLFHATPEETLAAIGIRPPAAPAPPTAHPARPDRLPPDLPPDPAASAPTPRSTDR